MLVKPRSAATVCLHLLAASGFLLPGIGHALPDGTIYFATISVNERSVRYEMALPADAAPTATLDRSSTAIKAPAIDAVLRAIDGKVRILADGKSCSAGKAARIAIPDRDTAANGRIAIDFDCPSAATTIDIQYDLSGVLGAGHRTLALLAWEGGSQQFMFGRDAPQCRLDLLRGTVSGGPVNYLVLAIERTLTASIHLLFLFCLLLPVTRRPRALRIVGAFVLANSLSVQMIGSGLIVLPARITEALIALTLVCVAVDNLLSRDRSFRKRWMIVFAFGLIHGVGLAMPFVKTPPPMDDAVLSLLKFNVGVEIGLGIFLILALPLLLWMRRNRWEAQAVSTISVVALAIGIALFAVRVLT